ncbi:conserved hypothetical protein [uncultured Mycobacterium sp.]|uniref:Uncharacterized protein n=1 Tax=uncultured Mycobacterium sp. TaxID=171292 RepID=A0A1Y5PKT9_9MYCO|nr:conserved hypothetical protein [uncultured Mycobacterium sp.]
MTAARLGDDILGWARLAGYGWDAETGALTTRLDGCQTELSVRAAANGRFELHEDIDGDRRMLLYALNLDVVERHLFALLGDDIRAQLDLPFLELPAAATDVAGGYSLGPTARGFQTLVRIGAGPVAAAPRPGTSLGTLVPLSHLLDLSISELKQSFLHQDGEPLIEGDRYRRRPPTTLDDTPGKADPAGRTRRDRPQLG